MKWVCNISNEAVKQFRRLPSNRQKLLSDAIDEMEQEPLKGDVRTIKSGKFQGYFRKRVANIGLFFPLIVRGTWLRLPRSSSGVKKLIVDFEVDYQL